MEEEVRAEALVRDIGAFENFLCLAAVESGNTVNLDKISQDIGVASSTINSYYQILEDCLIVERVEPFTQSVMRKKLIKSAKYLFFDLGLRRLAAKEPPVLPRNYLGVFFEQFIGLELIRWARLQKKKVTVHFWRDSGGQEVDWLLAWEGNLLPIEVKWTDSPSPRDARRLELFLREYPQAKQGLVACQVEQPQALGEKIEAISWKELFQRLDRLEEFS
jgi:uncharacterized protein